MEFKFRAVDHRVPQYHSSSSSSNIYFVSRQTFPVNKPDPFIRRNPHMMTNPCDINEAMRRELELLRYREERMVAEIQRQRNLKEEAWRELIMLEEQMAKQRVPQMKAISFHNPTPFYTADKSGGLVVLEKLDPEQFTAKRKIEAFSTMAVDDAHQQMASQRGAWTESLSSHERRGMPLNTAVHPYHGGRPEEQVKGYDSHRLEASALPRVQEFLVHDNKPQLEADKSGLVVLEKPDPKQFTAKRKTEMASAKADDDTHQRNSEKNHEVVWSCALCQVTATSEVVFEAHIHGKKHRKNEAALKVQKSSKISKAPLPKKRKYTLEAIEKYSSPGTKQQELKIGESVKNGKAEDLLNPKTVKSSTSYLNDKEDEQQIQKQRIGDPKIKQQEAAMDPNSEGDAKFTKKNFKFWCKVCKVGAYFQSVMDAHVNGKKHLVRIQELGPSCEPASIVTAVASSNN